MTHEIAIFDLILQPLGGQYLPECHTVTLTRGSTCSGIRGLYAPGHQYSSLTASLTANRRSLTANRKQLTAHRASLQDAIEAAYTQLLRYGIDATETGRAIERGYERGTSTTLSVAMLDTLADDLASMSRGNASGGWTAEDALGLAIAATAACNGNTMDAVATCAAITGDSDSAASIAGTLCGAAYGIATIDAELIEGLCEVSVVRKMAAGVGGGS